MRYAGVVLLSTTWRTLALVNTEGLCMDTEGRLHTLEFRYRGVSSAASVAKANYLALSRSPSATLFAIEHAKTHLQRLNALKRVIAAQMGKLEDLEQDPSL
jgi:hypothetical protein